MTTEHLRGPWLAVLANRGDVYPTFEMAAEMLPDDAEMTISVVRGTALPVDNEDADGMRTASSCKSYNVGDEIFEIDAWLIDPDDAGCGAEARYAQAQAMADGLNAAAERGSAR